jgi:dihydrofolate reductase
MRKIVNYLIKDCKVLTNNSMNWFRKKVHWIQDNKNYFRELQSNKKLILSN